MCGLVYSQSFDGTPVNQRVLAQYKEQISRGVQGFGAFNGKHLVKAAEEKRMLRWLKKKKNESELLLFHHRWPTSTINVRRAAHPFTTKDYFGDTQYVLIHNGHIGNSSDLFEKHQELGIEYHSMLEDMTYNDSEALLWDLALTLEGKQDKLKAYGGIAFICMKMVNGTPDKLYFGRNYSKPLNLKRDKTQLFLSSEGEGEPIKQNQLYTYNYQLKRLTDRHFYIPAVDPSWNDNRWQHYQQSGVKLYKAPSVTTYRDNDYDGYGDYTYELTTERFNETFTADGVIWYDQDGEEFYDQYNVYPMYYQRRDRATHIKDILGAPALQGLFPSLSPSVEQVKNTVISYLGRTKGNYSLAYWMMEAEYSVVEDQPLCEDRTRQLLLLEAAIDAVENESENVDDTSVHPLWQANQLEV
jgi:predicted glutamine amidotransferase